MKQYLFIARTAQRPNIKTVMLSVQDGKTNSLELLFCLGSKCSGHKCPLDGNAGAKCVSMGPKVSGYLATTEYDLIVLL